MLAGMNNEFMIGLYMYKTTSCPIKPKIPAPNIKYQAHLAPFLYDIQDVTQKNKPMASNRTPLN